jgi:hypothetical protein
MQWLGETHPNPHAIEKNRPIHQSYKATLEEASYATAETADSL